MVSTSEADPPSASPGPYHMLIPTAWSTWSRKPSVLGWPGESTKDDFYSRWRSPYLRLSPLKIFSIASLTLSALYFFHTFELHLSYELHAKDRIKSPVLLDSDTESPSSSTSTCFSRSGNSQSIYNTTLSMFSPSFVELHPGMPVHKGMDCYNFAATIPRSPLPGMVLPKRTTFHLYWRSDKLALSRRQVSLIHSILAMQDRETSDVTLWTNPAPAVEGQVRDSPLLRDSTLLTDFHKMYGPQRFQVKAVHWKTLAMGTPLEDYQGLEGVEGRVGVEKDLVRVLVLWTKGGIWVDMDTIMTGRDWRVLTEHEWVVQSDCHDKAQNALSGTMMHFNKNSAYLCEMMRLMSLAPEIPPSGSSDWSSHLYHKVYVRLLESNIAPFKILPFCFVDGYSCDKDNRLPDFFSVTEYAWGEDGPGAQLKKKVESVWAVHLHNQWGKQFSKTGWAKSLILDKIKHAVDAYRIG